MTNVIITSNPAREAGEHINTIIREHDGDVVCLLAGGSALNIVDYIEPGKKCFHQDCQSKVASDKQLLCGRSECRTIFIMGDERVSREPEVNNFLQLKSRYPNHPVTSMIIDTTPHDNESAKIFSIRIENIFSEKLIDLNNPKIISIHGLGTDGHTAGIFPMEEAAFRNTYQDDRTYVPVHLEGLKIDSRASFAPAWLLSNADELIGYVVGLDKLEILQDLNNYTKKLNERPAELLKLHKRSTIYTDQDIESE